MSVLARFSDKLNLLMSGRAGQTPEVPVVVPPTQRPPGAIAGGAFDTFLRFVERPDDRVAEMDYYDRLTDELPDAGKALSAFATMACTGTLTGQSRGTYTFRFPEDTPQELRDWMEPLQRLIRSHAYTITMGYCKFGSYPIEIVPGRIGDKLGVVGLNHIPPGTMFRNTNREAGPESYWLQMKHAGSMSEMIKLPQWRIAHFAVWSQVVTARKRLLYGTSIMRPVGRIGLQLLAMTDAMVVARLTRAAMRYVFQFDVSDIARSTDEIIKRIDEYARHFETERTYSVDGAFDSYKRPNIPDENFYLPGGKDLGFDLKTLEGDRNVSNIKDIEMLVRFYFGALGVPPEYLGHGRGDTGGRSSLSQIDINFARNARHLQLFGAAGFDHIVLVHMLLGGFDPERYPIETVPPTIGARDDLLQAQVRMLQSQILANLQAAGMDLTLDPRWVLRTFLNMEEELAGLADDLISKMFKDPEPAEPSSVTRPGRGSEEWRKISQGTGEFINNIRSLIAMGEGDDSAGPLYGRDQPTVHDVRQGLQRAF